MQISPSSTLTSFEIRVTLLRISLSLLSRSAIYALISELVLRFDVLNSSIDVVFESVFACRLSIDVCMVSRLVARLANSSSVDFLLVSGLPEGGGMVAVAMGYHPFYHPFV